MDKLLQLDRAITLLLNSPHTPFLDALMYLLSAKWPWLLTVVALIFFLFYKKPAREALFVIITTVLLITITDQLSSHVIKPLVERLRPTFDPVMKYQICTAYGYLGGGFSFVSGHATNFFAIATFTALVFRNHLYSFVVFLMACTVAYSRIYLGVHFFSDVLAGAVLGTLVAWCIAVFYHHIRSRWLSGAGRTSTKKLYAPTINYWTLFLFIFLAMNCMFALQMSELFAHVAEQTPITVAW